MSDPQTVNVLLSVPVRGSNPGTWDVPVNNDFTAIDGMFGGVASVAVGSTNITLTKPTGTPVPGAGPTQSQNAVVRFTGVLTANINVTLSLPGPMIIDNRSTGNFVIFLGAATAGDVICPPPGNIRRIYNDGTNVYFVDLQDVGTYWDYAGATVPAWVSGCTKPPFLLCDGSTFSAVTYPALNSILGTTTLPDHRGRTRFALNGGTNRLISSGGLGIDGDTRFSGGGNNTMVQSQIPNYALTVTLNDPQHAHNVKYNSASVPEFGGGNTVVTGLSSGGSNNGSNAATPSSTGITVGVSSAGGDLPYLPPGVVGGITMIRAG